MLQFNFRAVTVGATFFLIAGTYALVAPVWGCVADRYKHLMPRIMVVCALTCACALLLMGPSPLLGLSKLVRACTACRLIVILHPCREYGIIAAGLVIMGLSMGGLFIPTFEMTLNLAKLAFYLFPVFFNYNFYILACRSHGYPDNFSTYGLVSGMFQSGFSFGLDFLKFVLEFF